MSQAITYTLHEVLGGSEKLKVMYQIPSSYTDLYFDVAAEIDNSTPSSNTGENRGLVSTLFTGADSVKYGNFVNGGSGDLNQSMIQVTGDLPVNLRDSSCLFEFTLKEKKRGILLGSFEKEVVTINGVDSTGVKGFNFGINDRGHLFFNSSDESGEYIEVADEIELSEKNIVSFSMKPNEVVVARHDFLNQRVQTQSLFTKASVIQNPTGIFLGASTSFLGVGMTGVPQDHVDSFYLQSFLLFSGNIAPTSLFGIASGLIADRTDTPASVSSVDIVTGYSTTKVYETGVTGWRPVITGSRTVPTGDPRVNVTGGYTPNTIDFLYEGDRYKIVHDMGDWSYEEEVGLLRDANFGTYNPTGQAAHSILGLDDTLDTKDNFTENITTPTSSITIPLYGVEIMTGQLSTLSGVSKTPLTKTVNITGEASSGLTVDFSDAAEHQKDMVYYLGKRL